MVLLCLKSSMIVTDPQLLAQLEPFETNAPNLVEAVSRTRIPEVLGAVQVFIKSTMDCSEIGLPVRRHVIEPISP